MVTLLPQKVLFCVGLAAVDSRGAQSLAIGSIGLQAPLLLSRVNNSGSWWTQMPIGNQQCASLVMLGANESHRSNHGRLGENELGVALHRRSHCELLKCCLAQSVKVHVRSL